jgi:hypothetical protein
VWFMMEMTQMEVFAVLIGTSFCGAFIALSVMGLLLGGEREKERNGYQD